MRFHSLAAVLFLSAAGCVGSSAPQAVNGPPGAQGQAGPAEEPAAAEESAGLRDLLERSMTDPELRRSLKLLTECRGDAGMRTMRLWGDGLGVWEGKRQFQLAGDQVAAVLERLHAADFAAFAPLYGGPKQPDPREPPAEGSAILIICRVHVSLDGHGKESVQRAKGEQSVELRALAESLLAIGETAAKKGVEPASLLDGLQGVGKGALDPRAMRVLLHRKPAASQTEAGGGFLLRLEGREAITRLYDPASGYGPDVRLELDVPTVQKLALVLADLDPARMPANLWAPVYTEVGIEVLDHGKEIQAQRFAGLEPTTHGKLQATFDALVEALLRLQDRVAAEGTAQAE